jgi:hypothetical protein
MKKQKIFKIKIIILNRAINKIVQIIIHKIVKIYYFNINKYRKF